MFTYFKNNNFFVLMICLLSTSIICPMNRDDFPRVESNMITPYIGPATSLALARYGSEVADAMMPRLFPEHPLANALVPQALRYGGYAVGSYLIAKNLQIKPADLLKSETAKKIAKNGLNFAPAVLCHPHVAQAATATCSQLASHQANSTVTINQMLNELKPESCDTMDLEK